VSSTENSIQVAWNAPQAKSSAVISGFILEASFGDNSTHQVFGAIFEKLAITANITQLPPGLVVYVRVRVESAGGESEASPVGVCETRPLVPDVPPAPVVAGLSMTPWYEERFHYKISLKMVPAFHNRSRVFAFRIQGVMWPSVETNPPESEWFDMDPVYDTRTTQEPFEALTRYAFRVAAENVRGISNFSEPVFVTTGPKPRFISPPLRPFVIAASNTSIVLRIPSVVVGGVKVVNCSVSVDDALGANQARYGEFPPSDVTIDPLPSGRTFQIFTSCRTLHHPRVSSVSVGNTRLELDKDSPPQAVMTTRRDIFLHLPSVATTGETFVNHIVLIDNGNGGELTQEWEGSGTAEEYSVEWLEPGTKYHLRVLSEDASGQTYLVDFFASTLPEPEEASRRLFWKSRKRRWWCRCQDILLAECGLRDMLSESAKVLWKQITFRIPLPTKLSPQIFPFATKISQSRISNPDSNM